MIKKNPFKYIFFRYLIWAILMGTIFGIICGIILISIVLLKGENIINELLFAFVILFLFGMFWGNHIAFKKVFFKPYKYITVTPIFEKLPYIVSFSFLSILLMLNFIIEFIAIFIERCYGLNTKFLDLNPSTPALNIIVSAFTTIIIPYFVLKFVVSRNATVTYKHDS